mmetsp:Transcript_11427/g.20201  ORF Transcript_11427/g.20201 Transcript_11427/m.20201 type:complete len:226 (-) Transcript_11427:1924-2601(-)
MSKRRPSVAKISSSSPSFSMSSFSSSRRSISHEASWARSICSSSKYAWRKSITGYQIVRNVMARRSIGRKWLSILWNWSCVSVAAASSAAWSLPAPSDFAVTELEGAVSVATGSSNSSMSSWLSFLALVAATLSASSSASAMAASRSSCESGASTLIPVSEPNNSATCPPSERNEFTVKAPSSTESLFNSRFWFALDKMFSSIVCSLIRRYICTSRVWPIRCALS